MPSFHPKSSLSEIVFPRKPYKTSLNTFKPKSAHFILEADTGIPRSWSISSFDNPTVLYLYCHAYLVAAERVVIPGFHVRLGQRAEVPRLPVMVKYVLLIHVVHDITR